MNFELLTLTGAKFRGEVREVSLTTASGQVGILPHHEPLTAIMVAGPVVVHPAKGEQQVFATFGGLLEVTADSVRVLADEAEHADELVQKEIEAALAKAQTLKAGARDRHELHRAQEMIDRHTVRLDVVHMHRRHRSRG